MDAIKLNEKSIVYVLCPAYIKSGGPELLHQLVKRLNDNEIKAYITYYNINEENKNYRSADFDKYTNTYKTVNEIEDDSNHIMIMPETVVAIKESKKFKNIKKAIWWLSVDNFLKAYRFIYPMKLQGKKNFVKMLFGKQLMYTFKDIKKIQYHLCQSQYAIEFLKQKGITDVIYLSDYINDTYLNIQQSETQNKEDIVLYNPKKGYHFTKKIMQVGKNINWVPIQNLTTEQVKELLLKSKVYIDFGNHPGKDRFPREAAVCGCCVITGKRGSAKYNQDVAIENEFKFDDRESNINQIIEKIELCLNDYENQTKKFEKYRGYIKAEKKKFEEDVTNIFERG